MVVQIHAPERMLFKRVKRHFRPSFEQPYMKNLYLENRIRMPISMSNCDSYNGMLSLF